MSVSARRPAASVAILTLIIWGPACQKTVADPVDDELFDIDIVEVGVDYRTDVTKLWLRYTPDSYGASSGAADWTITLANGTPIVAGPHVFVARIRRPVRPSTLSYAPGPWEAAMASTASTRSG